MMFVFSKRNFRDWNVLDNPRSFIMSISRIFLVMVFSMYASTEAGDSKGMLHIQQLNTELVFSSLVEPPFLNKTDTFYGQSCVGFIPDIVHIISSRLGRPHRIVLVEYEGYGVPDPGVQGGWTGLIGDVINGRADVAAAAMTVTSTRAKVVDFTHPFMETGIVALYYSDGLSGWPASIDSPLYFFDKGVEVVCIRGSLTYYYLQYERIRPTTFGYMLSQMLASRPLSLVWTKEEGAQKVRASRGPVVFFVERVFGEYMVSNDKWCTLNVTRTYLNAKSYAFAVAKNNPLKMLLNDVIEDTMLDGTISALYDKWCSGKCSQHEYEVVDSETQSDYNYESEHDVTANDDNQMSHFMRSGSTNITPLRYGPCEWFRSTFFMESGLKFTCLLLSVLCTVL